MHIEEWHKFRFENRGKFTQREAKASIWFYAENTGPCPRVSSRAVRKPDQSILRKLTLQGKL
jgi:hypothetical protein